MRINSHLSRRALCALCGLLAGLSAATASGTDQRQHQRQLYELARLALKAEQPALFEHFESRLHDYPLYPYLVYDALRRRLDSAADAEIERFIATYQDTPLAERMRGHWLYRLYHDRRWAKFLEVYDGRSDPVLRCYDLRARVRARRLTGVVEQARRLWLVGHSQSKACDRLFAWLDDRGGLTPALIRKRLDLALAQDNTGLAAYLADKLGPAAQARVSQWRRVLRAPVAALTDPRLEPDSAWTRRLVARGVRRAAQTDVARGKRLWESLRPHYAFEPARRLALARDIALLAAYRQDPRAQAWLRALPPAAINEAVWLWRARTALYRSDWPAVQAAIEGMPEAERQRRMWRYWLARALEHSGHPRTARALLEALAAQRSYYGFLAADHLGRPYAIVDEPLLEHPGEAKSLLSLPAVARARELVHAGQFAPARREWNRALRGLDEEALKRAAWLAHRWGWHPEAIRTVAKTAHSSDLGLRFPAPFRQAVLANARRSELEPAWVYAVMRRESAFRPNARSSAGALGLMQIKPATARHVARKTGLASPTSGDLLDTARNLRFGTVYLARLLQRFGGSLVLATAAYNAGPRRVERWLPEGQSLPADQWIDTISYFETRRYLRAVLAYTTIYDWKLTDRIKPLARRMPAVDAASILPDVPASPELTDSNKRAARLR